MKTKDRAVFQACWLLIGGACLLAGAGARGAQAGESAVNGTAPVRVALQAASTQVRLAPVAAMPGLLAVGRTRRGQADLKVRRVKITPNQPTKGGPARIEVTVRNYGVIKPSKACSLSMSVWSVNNNGQHVANRTSLPNLIPWYTNNIPRLDPGQEVTITKDVTFQFSGRHKVEGVIITEGLGAGEENGQNNTYYMIFPVKALLPDLVVCFKKYNKSPAHATSTYPVEIRNIGKAPSAPCELRFWIRHKGVRHYGVSSIPPGGKRSVQRDVYWASKRISAFSLRIDWKGQVAEMSEDNNTIEGEICTAKYCNGGGNSVTACSDTIH